MTQIYRIPVSLFAALGFSACLTAQPEGQASTIDLPARTAYINGQIFDGTDWTRGTLVEAGGRLIASEPRPEDRVVDLAGRWVTPPFCEAHNHNLGTDADPSQRIADYLRDGVFYVRILSNLPRLTDRMRDQVNRAGSVDVAWANGTLTAPGGHPISFRLNLLRSGRYPGFDEASLANHAYFEISDLEALEAVWPLVLEHRPDVLKISLVRSDQFEARRNDDEYFGRRGLNPALVPAIVELAHAASLPVSAHVENAADFRNAIQGGVDDIAHAPGFADPDPISLADAQLAAVSGVTVTLTYGVARWQEDEEGYQDLIAVQRANATLLRDAGVRLAIGSDNFTDTSLGEVQHLRDLAVFDPQQLLQMWTANCAQLVFPGRDIGRLVPGSEASFLVHSTEPLSGAWSPENITMRIKQGRAINLPDRANTD